MFSGTSSPVLPCKKSN